MQRSGRTLSCSFVCVPVHHEHQVMVDKLACSSYDPSFCSVNRTSHKEAVDKLGNNGERWGSSKPNSSLATSCCGQ